MSAQPAYQQDTMFEMPAVEQGYFKVSTGKPQELPEGEEFSLRYNQVVSGRFVGEVSGFSYKDGRLVWEITCTEVNLGPTAA